MTTESAFLGKDGNSSAPHQKDANCSGNNGGHSLPFYTQATLGTLFHADYRTYVDFQISCEAQGEFSQYKGEWLCNPNHGLASTFSYSLFSPGPIAQHRMLFQPKDSTKLYNVKGFAMSISSVSPFFMYDYTVQSRSPFKKVPLEPNMLGAQETPRWLTGRPKYHRLQHLLYYKPQVGSGGSIAEIFVNVISGGRRSSPPYCQLVVELWVDVGDLGARSQPQYIKVAHKKSFRIKLESEAIVTPSTSSISQFKDSHSDRNSALPGPLTQIVRRLKRISRPSVKEGYRRIEWTCDCGEELYGDFSQEATDLDDLELSLRALPGDTSTKSPSDSEQSAKSQIISRDSISRSSSSSRAALSTTTTDASSIDIIPPKFLALCVNTGGIYKTLAELETTRINSDGEAFSQMKKAYLQYRGMRSHLRFLIKPVTVEFVRFTLWNLRQGYVSVRDRPNSMPPSTCMDYDFISPPMPPEVFVHYLEHGDDDLSRHRYTWLPRLPKRLNNKVVDCGEAAEGWGVHVIEGPNREAVFWVLMITIAASVLASVLWTTLKRDIQGGTGLGALIVALPPAIMAAFLFRLGAT